jgi:hypothetical protein
MKMTQALHLDDDQAAANIARSAPTAMRSFQWA